MPHPLADTPTPERISSLGTREDRHMNTKRRSQSLIGTGRSPSSRIRRLGAVAALGLGTTLGACADPPIDPQQPAPTGVITGSLVYFGPRVPCDYSGTTPTQVKGRVLLTLVDNANPLPPEGTATRPADFLAVGGEDIFKDLANQCMPQSPSPADLAVQISVSVDFRWQHIGLGAPLAEADLTDPVKVAAARRGYRIQGFYDMEGDFNPLFSIAQTTTAGDVVGAAVRSSTDQRMKIVEFDSVTLRPLGQLVEGVAVTFGATVLTEPGVMRVADGGGALSSQVGIPSVPVDTSFPPIDLTLYGRSATDADRIPFDATLSALGLSGFVDFSDPVRNAKQYAWYVRPVDVDSDGNTTCTPGTGDLDCHPVFGTLGVQWYSPVVFLQRYQNKVELDAGIPSVAIVPAAGLATGEPGVQYPDVRLRVFPVAAVMPSPTHPECRAVYFANGSDSTNVAGLFAGLPAGSVGECAELPTGYYGVNALGGLAGTADSYVADMSSASETGWNIPAGSRFAAQVWRIPNELGDYNQVGDRLIAGHTDPGPSRCLAAADTSTAAPLCLPEQSLAGAVVIHDPDTSNAPSRRDPAGGSAICGAYPGLGTNNWAAAPYQEACCAPIQHLCNLPLCDVDTNVDQTWTTSSLTIRKAPTSIVGTTTYTLDGATVEVGIPNCVPFDMPQQCCPGTRP